MCAGGGATLPYLSQRSGQLSMGVFTHPYPRYNEEYNDKWHSLDTTA